MGIFFSDKIMFRVLEVGQARGYIIFKFDFILGRLGYTKELQSATEKRVIQFSTIIKMYQII